MGIAYTNYKKLLCIIGPTATGKTDVALELAKKFDGELIACDSRQIYQKLDLGTGKEANKNQIVVKKKGYWILDGIKVWLYDQVSFEYQYTVSDYIKDATKALHNILAQYKLPILVGGTGFYFDGLLNGVNTENIPANIFLRQELESMDLLDVQIRLKNLSLEVFEELNNSEKNNKRRLIRKIEILEHLQNEVSTKNKDKGLIQDHQILKIGLVAKKNILDKRIEQRVIKRIDHGMLQEAEDLHKQGLTFDRMRQLGLEYGVMADFLEGIITTKEQMIFLLQQKIKQYAKRQLTWFKRDQDIIWIDIADKNYLQKVEKLVQAWYNNGS
jgi:tRNA dimethylallyltransferase